MHSKQIIKHSFLMKKYFKKISLLRVFSLSLVKSLVMEFCNTEHSLRFHGGGRDNLYPMISESGDSLSSLVQVSLPLLLGILEDSTMKLAKSVMVSRLERYGGRASMTGANSPNCCGRLSRSLRNFRIPVESRLF